MRKEKLEEMGKEKLEEMGSRRKQKKTVNENWYFFSVILPHYFFKMKGGI